MTAPELQEKFFINNIGACSKEANRVYETIEKQNDLGEVSLCIKINGSQGIVSYIKRELRRDGFAVGDGAGGPGRLTINW